MLLVEWTDPMVIVGLAQFTMAGVLAIFTKRLWDSTSNYSRQVEIQTGFMKENIGLAKDQADIDAKKVELAKSQVEIEYKKMEHSRLLKQYEKIVEEMTLLVAPLYGRRNDKSLFSLNYNRAQRIETMHLGKDLVQERYDYVTFWDTIDQNIYLNRSDVLKNALTNHNAEVENYFAIRENREEKERWEKQFYDTTLPYLTKVIENRYEELDKELKEYENKLQLSNNK